MSAERNEISAWIAREILPHEAQVRAWLRRRWRTVGDVDDIIHDAYCRVARLPSVDHIDNPRAYFYRTVHNIVVDLANSVKMIPHISVSQNDYFAVMDNEPPVDRALEAVEELKWVMELLNTLSPTHRKVILLRRVEGLSRKETAQRLQISENEVKNFLVRGLRKISKRMSEQGWGQLNDTGPKNSENRENEA